MADQHEKGNGEVVRGQDERTPLTPDDPVVEPGDDLAGIRADDALLDALGGRDGDRPDSLVDDELNALLMAWRDEVDSSPVGELVDTDTAVATIAAARPSPPSRHRFLIPLASAAAIVAIAFTGVSLVARDALPGDSLWGLTRVLYSDHAKSVEAAVTVKSDLDTARAALRLGNLVDARAALANAGAHLPSILASDGKEELVQTHSSLMDRLTSTGPAPSSSSAVVPPNPGTTAQAPTSTPDPLPTTQPVTSSTPSPPPSSSTTTEPPSPSGETQPAPPPASDPNGGNATSSERNGEQSSAKEQATP
ncbi:anti-sigma-D factor RsdA [Actinosynnema sp.]|uniref:anti-sigma-D factor RsdA n=1 Tax=Actinosynnema sp. TaxID=1872144 RepID=UPI003F8391A7